MTSPRTRAGVLRRTALALGTAAALLGGGLFGAAVPAGADTPANGLGTWNFHQAHITKAAQHKGRDGAGIIVAVVDTWVDAKHPHLAGRVLVGADCTDGPCEPGPQGKDDCGHGTHVAGTVASKDWGVAPAAKILPVRVLTYDAAKDECSGSTSDVAEGVRWATRNGADVINLSLAAQLPGLGTASPVTRAVQDAVDAGLVVVFAAGNNSRPVADNYGGRALIVAATSPSGDLATYSQRGAGVSVAAPGGEPHGEDCAKNGSDCVISTWLDHGYAALAGTSMAAPHVSGLAALLLAEHATWTNTEVNERIKATARATVSGGGAGVMDAAAAVGASASDGGNSPNPKPSSAKPTHRATASDTHKPSSSPSAKPSKKPKPSGGPTPKPTASTSSGPVTEQPRATESDDDDDSLPLAPLAIAAACMAGLVVGLVGVGRHSFRGR